MKASKKQKRLWQSGIRVFALSLFFFTFSFAPLFAASNFADFVYDILIGTIIEPVTYLIAAAIMVVFFYNSALFLFKSSSGEEKKKISQALLWSVLAIFIMLSVWGIARMVASTLTLET